MFDRFPTALIVVVVAALAPATVSAQTMTFGGDEEEKKDKDKDKEKDEKEKKGDGEVSDKAKKFLKEGKKLFDKEKYDQASLIFFKILQQKGIESPAAKPEARFRLAKTLLNMDLYQGALTELGKIVSSGASHPYYIPTLSTLLALAENIPADPNLQKHLASYADLFPKQIPQEHRDRYAYLTGRHFYRKLKVQPASRMFKAIGEESKYYAKSQYILAITHVANYSAKPAVAAFKSVLRFLKPKQQEGSLTAEEEKLLELTNLGMARVFYSTGDYKTSLEYFDKIGRESPRWPQALFEESWAYFQLNRFNKALGNLHSLNSPFFRDSYFPEAPILAAVIYFYNCKYERTQNQLDEFEYLYEPLEEKMNAVLEEQGNGNAFFNWYQKLQNGEVDFDSDVRRVIEAALEDKQVQAKFELVEQTNKEIEKIKSMPNTWRSSKLGQSLIKSANLAKSFAKNDAGSVARQRLKRRANKLSDLVQQKKEIEFEISRAKKGQLEAEVPSGQEIEANRRKAGDVEASSQEMYWKFKGEYWRDELGHYVFNIGSECSR